VLQTDPLACSLAAKYSSVHWAKTPVDLLVGYSAAQHSAAWPSHALQVDSQAVHYSQRPVGSQDCSAAAPVDPVDLPAGYSAAQRLAASPSHAQQVDSQAVHYSQPLAGSQDCSEADLVALGPVDSDDPLAGYSAAQCSAASPFHALQVDFQAVHYSQCPAGSQDCSAADPVALGPVDPDGYQRCPDHPAPLSGSQAAKAWELPAPIQGPALEAEPL